MERRRRFYHEDPESKEGLSAMRILVPVNGNDSEPNQSSLHALKVACDIAQLYPHSEILLVHILEVPRNLPMLAEMTDLAEKSGNLLDYAEEIVKAKHGVKVKSELLQVRAGKVAYAILDEAKDIDADLIVIGTDGIDELSVHQIDPLTKSILDRSTCAVVLVRSSFNGQVIAS